MGVNRGTSDTHRARQSRLIKTYSVGGKFGMASDTGFCDGKVMIAFFKY